MADASVRNHFTVAASDVTPQSVRKTVRMLFAPVSDSAEISVHCSSVLSDSERDHLERKKGNDHRARFAQRRAFRRFCASVALGTSSPLSEIVFEDTDKGRPFLRNSPEFWFSFSSCRFGMLGAWSSSFSVGVDIEDRTRDLDSLALARQFYSTSEAKTVERLRPADRLEVFYQLWSLKEAALKSIGEGLPFGLDAFEFRLNPGPRCVNTPSEYGRPDRFNAYGIDGNRTSGALITRCVA
jgi:4'-phosphopantetheinyl transferase